MKVYRFVSLDRLRGLTMSQERGLREGETQSSLHNDRKVEPRRWVHSITSMKTPT